MPTTLVRVQGGPKLRRTLKKAGADLDDLKTLNARLSKYLAFRIAAFAPRRSGRLAGSVRGSRARTKVSAMAGRKAIPYAGPVNWGWPSRPNAAAGWRGGPIAANNFLMRGADAVQPLLVREWTGGVQAILDKVEGAPR